MLNSFHFLLSKQRRRRDIPREQYANETVQQLTETGEIDPKDVVSRQENPSTTTMAPFTTTHDPTTPNGGDQLPYVCFNKSQVAPDPKKVYGYFSRTVMVRSEYTKKWIFPFIHVCWLANSIKMRSFSPSVSTDPLTAPVVVGKLWIKREEGVYLNISWSGSPPYSYCYDYKVGPHNITTNDTCDDWATVTTPWLTIKRYWFVESSFTILFHVRNQITNHTKIITINTYEVKKQSQLSVIVVPVAFILSAVVAIIFGVAHYVQTRNR